MVDDACEKEGDEKNFVIQDAAMNDLIRPTLYEAWHDIIPVIEPVGGETMEADVVGPVCETGDYLATSRRLPRLSQGDLLATMTAGAYGAVQAGTYNTRPLVPEVLVKDIKWALVRPRQTYEELIGLDRLAGWLAGREMTLPPSSQFSLERQIAALASFPLPWEREVPLPLQWEGEGTPAPIVWHLYPLIFPSQGRATGPFFSQGRREERGRMKQPPKLAGHNFALLC